MALRAAQRPSSPHLANAELRNPVVCDTEEIVPAYLNLFSGHIRRECRKYGYRARGRIRAENVS